MKNFLLYHPAGARSAKRLSQYMGLKFAKSFDSEKQRPDWLIRWGTPLPVPLAPEHGVLNGQAPLTRQQDRFAHLSMLRESGLNTPKFARSWKELGGDRPILGRTLPSGDGQASKGVGLVKYEVGDKIGSHDYFMEYVDKAHEFRVDVIAHMTRVRQLTPGDKAAVAWNTQGVYDAPHVPVPSAVEPMGVAALKSLRLDFGAVDLIVGKDGDVYVLEVNTAPELSNPTLEWYARQFAWLTGMDEDKLPGWNAVEE